MQATALSTPSAARMPLPRPDRNLENQLSSQRIAG